MILRRCTELGDFTLSIHQFTIHCLFYFIMTNSNQIVCQKQIIYFGYLFFKKYGDDRILRSPRESIPNIINPFFFGSK